MDMKHIHTFEDFLNEGILNEASNMTKNTIIVGKLEFASSDFPQNMNWKDAKAACEDLGKGWRLPTIDELMELDLETRMKLGLWQNSWWTGTDSVGNMAFVYGSTSNPARKFQVFKYDLWKVRAVRQK
jgi:hypothetical protein